MLRKDKSNKNLERITEVMTMHNSNIRKRERIEKERNCIMARIVPKLRTEHKSQL